VAEEEEAVRAIENRLKQAIMKIKKSSKKQLTEILSAVSVQALEEKLVARIRFVLAYKMERKRENSVEPMPKRLSLSDPVPRSRPVTPVDNKDAASTTSSLAAATPSTRSPPTRPGPRSYLPHDVST